MINVAEQIKGIIVGNNGVYVASLTAIANMGGQPIEQDYLNIMLGLTWGNTQHQVAPTLAINENAAKANYNPTAHAIQLNPKVLVSPLITLDMILFESGNAQQDRQYLSFINPNYIAQTGLRATGRQKAATEFTIFFNYVQALLPFVAQYQLNALPEQAQKSINEWNNVYVPIGNYQQQEARFCDTPHRPGAAISTAQMYAAEFLKGTAIRNAVLAQCLGIYFQNETNPFAGFQGSKENLATIRKEVAAVIGDRRYALTNEMTSDALYTAWNTMINSLITIFNQYTRQKSSFSLNPRQIGAQAIIGHLQQALI